MMAQHRCYGYDTNPDGGLVINSDETAIVRWIFERYISGDSLGKIAAGLEEKGIPSPTGRPKWNREAINKLISIVCYFAVLHQRHIRILTVLIQKIYHHVILHRSHVLSCYTIFVYLVRNSGTKSKKEMEIMRKLLLVIDMQNDFIDGALGTQEAAAIVDRVVEEIGKYPPENIIATQDTHGENYLDTQEGRNLPVTHCVKGTPGWELNPKVAAALRGAAVIDKPTFGSTELAEQMTKLAQRDELDITLVGLCTDICVVSNALLLKAFLPETPVHVIANCCAGVTPESHQTALTTMRMCQVDIQ